jgi:hypothetical protein
VNVTVTARPRIAVSPTSVQLNAVGTSTPTQTVSITNSGQGALSGLSVTVQYGSGASGWLITTLNGSAAPTTLTLQPIVAGLAAGSYSATVQINSAVADNTPLQLPVTLTVTPAFTLTIALSGNGSGQVTANPAGTSGAINCTLTAGTLSGTCAATYAVNTQVTLTANATTGTFGGWGGACSGTSPCVVTITQNTTVTANFGIPGTLTVFGAGNGNGTVTSAPAGINCTITTGTAATTGCSAPFASGAAVSLSATASAGFTFGGFFGDCASFTQCNVTMSAPRSVIAAFNSATTTTLQNGVPVANLSGGQGSQRYFRITVPTGQTRLSVTMTGGTGDADLYVRFGQLPTFTTFDCVSGGTTTVETCLVANPAAGDWFIEVHGFAPFNGVTLTATHQAPTAASPVISNVTSALVSLNTCQISDGGPNGSVFNHTFNFTDPNGDVAFTGTPVILDFAFQPGGSTGALASAVFSSTGTGSNGMITIQRCYRFGTATSMNFSLSLRDAAGNISNAIASTLAKPAGANSIGLGSAGVPAIPKGADARRP